MSSSWVIAEFGGGDSFRHDNRPDQSTIQASGEVNLNHSPILRRTPTRAPTACRQAQLRGGSPAISGAPDRSYRGEGERAAAFRDVVPESGGPGFVARARVVSGQGFGLAESPGVMGAGGLAPSDGRGSGTALGVDSGGGVVEGGSGRADDGADGRRASRRGRRGPSRRAQDGPATVGGPVWTTVPPTGPPRNPQLGPLQGAGKSSQVSQCVHPVMPAASVKAASRRLVRDIPLSFRFRDVVGRFERPGSS